MARLKCDWAMQFFAQVYLRPDGPNVNYKIISKIRCELASILDIAEILGIMCNHWKGELKQTFISLFDATCYESFIRYPTDEKLLWEGYEWINKKMKRICKSNKLRMPRSRFLEQKRKQLSFAKARRKTYQMKRARKKSLLYLLKKLIGQLIEVELATKSLPEQMASSLKRFHTNTG